MNSKNKELLQKLLNGETVTDFTPQSRVESYLKACINKSGVAGLPTPTIDTSTFSTARINQIIVPAGSGTAYKSATNWSALADYIVEATA